MRVKPPFKTASLIALGSFCTTLNLGSFFFSSIGRHFAYQGTPRDIKLSMLSTPCTVIHDYCLSFICSLSRIETYSTTGLIVCFELVVMTHNINIMFNICVQSMNTLKGSNVPHKLRLVNLWRLYTRTSHNNTWISVQRNGNSAVEGPTCEQRPCW